LVPVDLAIEGLYKDRDRRRGKHANNEKPGLSQMQLRRREQNRLSQQTFREKKAKHIRDLEQKLKDVEAGYNELSKSHKLLQLEYSKVKQILD
ncbi:hypothetical protein BKA61DRAFT_461246, partial [Leptodontidium sp. MPI-SDFR-AT-0119]